MNVPNQRIIARTLTSLLAFLVIFQVIAEEAEPQSRSWHTAINSEIAPKCDDGMRFSLGTVAQGPIHLIGGFVFENAVVAAQKPTIVVIEGSQADDGTFVPNVELQVSDDPSGKWQTVASFLTKPTAKITVYPGMMIFGLKVKLNVLRPFINKHKFGRAVLRDGKEAVFELSDLAPPPKDNDKP